MATFLHQFHFHLEAMSQIELHRDKLYYEVWTTPISRLAPQYGLSDVGLRKICRKLSIPVPDTKNRQLEDLIGAFLSGAITASAYHVFAGGL